jgi:ligand-binding sensor domain-containing protein
VSSLLTQGRPISIWSIFLQNDGSLLLGSQDGLNSYQPGTNEAKPFAKYGAIGFLKNRFVYQIHRTADSTIWLATSAELFRFDEQDGVAEQYWVDDEGKFQIPATEVFSLFEEQDATSLLANNS